MGDFNLAVPFYQMFSLFVIATEVIWPWVFIEASTIIDIHTLNIFLSLQCVSDERWGDWRPHLAMMLSNQTSRSDLDRKSICTLGDTLGKSFLLF